MRTIPLRFWGLGALLVTINVLGLLWIRAALAPPESTLWIDAVSPTERVDDVNRISFVFCREAVGASQVGDPLGISPFEVIPAAPGTWVWGSTRRLDFELSEPLLPGRTYRFEARTALGDQIVLPMVGRRVFEFKTRALTVQRVELRRVEEGVAIVELRFDQPVAPESLRSGVSVESYAGQTLAAKLVGIEPATEHALRVEVAGHAGFRIRLAAGLCGFGGIHGIAEEFVRVVSLPVGLHVDNVSASAPRLDAPARVAVSLSRRLDYGQSLDAVEIDPPVTGLTRSLYYDDVVLRGDFRPGETYAITLPAGIRAEDGTTLEESRTRNVEIPGYAPAVVFPFGRGQMSPSGNRALAFDSVGVGAVRFSAWRVHSNNIVDHLRGESRAATSRALATHRWWSDGDRREVRHERIDLKRLLGERVGVYRLEAAAEGRRWVSDTALVTVSDLGLAVRRGSDEWCVWVTSVESGESLEGVELELRSYNDQVLSHGRTGPDGTCRLAADEGLDGSPFVLIAARGDDLNYLPASRTALVLDDVDQGGRAWPESYEALLYAERGIYQPGETMRVTSLIRSDAGIVPEPFPLELRVARPDGREVARLVATPAPDGQGFAHFDVSTVAGEMTGPYRLTLHLPGAAEVLGETETLVEPFVPPRLEVEVTGAEQFLFGTAPTFAVQSDYLFGAPAAQLPCRGVAWFRPRPFRSARFPDFDFEPAVARGTREVRVNLGPLDEAGRGTLVIDRPDDLAAGVWSLLVSAEVQEPGARAVAGFAEARLDHASRIVGLALPDIASWRTDDRHEVRYVVSTLNDEVAEAPRLGYQLRRVVRGYRLEEVDGRTVWRSYEEQTLVEEGEIDDAGSDGSLGLQVAAVGEYRLVVTDSETGWSTAARFHATLSGDLSTAVGVRAPERIELRVQPAIATPGETVRVSVKSPFAGRLFLTLEAAELIESRVVDLPDAHGTFDMTLPVDVRGTAFVAATVVRGVAHDRAGGVGDWSPHRALGLARIELDVTAHRLDVALNVPDEARPGETLTISARVTSTGERSIVGAFRTRPWIHVWAIDEGIRLATDYAGANPVDTFLAPREARYRTLDTHGDLLPDLAPPSSLAYVGGDRDRAERLRRLASDVPRRASGVIWSAAMPTNDDGMIALEMTVPERSGTLRFFAVAAADDAYGAATGTSLLTAPLLVESTLPRVVAPGDRFDLRAKVFNQTDTPLSARVTVDWEGSVAAPSFSREPSPLEIPAHGTRSIVIPAVVTAPGTIAARVSIVAESPGTATVHRAEDRVEALCREVATIASEVVIERIPAGESRTLELGRRYRTETVRSRLRISASPTVELIAVVRQLVDYPYGCAEQTTSRLLPLITLDALLREGSIGVEECGFAPEDIAVRIEVGIRRLSALQSRDGGLSYWGSGDSSIWISAYATLALLEARTLGHAVASDLVDGLLDYLETRMMRGSNEPNLEAFVVRILGAGDRPQDSRLIRLAERRRELDLAGTAHLIRATLDAGEPGRARELLTEKLLSSQVRLSASGRLTSQAVQEAFLLEAVLALDPTHEWVPVLAQRLVASRRDGGWRNTLASAAAFRALARYHQSETERADFRGRIRIDDEWVPFDSGHPLVRVAGAGPWVIESEGGGTLSVTIEADGLASEPIAAHDHGLRVERRVFDHRGKPIDWGTITSGQIVRVEVHLSMPEQTSRDPNRDYSNIAIVDALPGGFEVESPRLATSSGIAQQRGARQSGDRPDHIEFLDDRVVIFTDAATDRVFRYAYRAVTPGRYTVPAIEASSMYDPTLRSVGESACLTVEP